MYASKAFEMVEQNWLTPLSIVPIESCCNDGSSSATNFGESMWSPFSAPALSPYQQAATVRSQQQTRFQYSNFFLSPNPTSSGFLFHRAIAKQAQYLHATQSN
jgi:hypothetical protein